jgi:FMN reductase
MYLVFSTSLNPDSRSRILARAAVRLLREHGDSVRLVDLAELDLPLCDGHDCYAQEAVVSVREAIEQARGILIATPIYNYNVAASAKNLVELTGKAWTEKVVGFLCAAGGSGSFMAPMGLANSLMLDFHSLILPRFVYASGESFSGQEIADTDCEDRVRQLVQLLVRVSSALHDVVGEHK